MRILSGRDITIQSVHMDGPWICEWCGHHTQFAECKSDVNRIFCVNENCRKMRIIDKRNRRIVESDGSIWKYDPFTSKKVRIR